MDNVEALLATEPAPAENTFPSDMGEATAGPTLIFPREGPAVAVSEEAHTTVDTVEPVESITSPEAPVTVEPQGWHYYGRILPDGTSLMTPLPQDVVDPLLTLMADA